jgi:class 3 adenylate cyclase
MYLGLHVGKLFYGNVGSRERLDFTVIGPAVNEASRIAAMCRSLDQPVLMSATSSAAWFRWAATRCAASRTRRSSLRWIPTRERGEGSPRRAISTRRRFGKSDIVNIPEA